MTRHRIDRTGASTTIIAALLLCGLAGGAEASTLASVRVDPGYPLANTTPTGQYTYTAGATATDSLTLGTAGSGSAYYTGNAWAIADYGVLKTYATATMEHIAYQSYGSTSGGPAGSGSPLTRQAAKAHAEVTDTITISGGAGIGYLKINLSTDGTTSWTASQPNDLFAPDAFGNLVVETAGNNTVGSWGFRGGSHSFTSNLIQFTYGTPFALTLAADATIDTSDKKGSTGDTYDFTGTADFGHTITLDTFSVYSDAAGTDLVGGTRVSGGSGAQYDTTPPTPPVPEPASLALLASALLGLGLARRRAG